MAVVKAPVCPEDTNVLFPYVSAYIFDDVPFVLTVHVIASVDVATIPVCPA